MSLVEKGRQKKELSDKEKAKLGRRAYEREYRKRKREMTAEEMRLKRHRESQKRYREKNRERYRAIQKKWRDSNPDKVKESREKYYMKLYERFQNEQGERMNE